MVTRNRSRAVFVFIFIGVFAYPISVSAIDWPQWRGTHRDGIWRENEIVEQFPPGGPKVMWRTPIRPGYSGPAVADGRVFVMDRERSKGEDGVELPPRDGSILGRERIICLDATTGEIVWEQSYECNYKISFPLGPRATPTVADGKVYTLGAMGDLKCFHTQNGQLIWSKNFVRDYQAPVPVWGWAAHPLVDDKQVICLVGSSGTAVVSFDKNTGQELWRTLSAEEIGYSGPQFVERGGQRQLIVWLDTDIHSMDPNSGRPFWSHPFPENQRPQRPVVHIATPVWHDSWLLVSEHYQGSLMLRLDSDKPAASVQWRSPPNRPANLNAVMSVPVIQGDLVFGVTNNGLLRCLRATTGEVIWETLAPTGKRRQANATAFLIPQNDRCFLFNDQGDLIISQLSEAGYHEFGRAHLLQPLSYGRGRTVVWSHPAFANRCIFARNDEEIICVSLSEAKQDDLAQMQGTWYAIDGIRDGDAIPHREIRKLTRTVKETDYEVSVESHEGVMSFPGRFTIDAAKMPKTIDANPARGSAQGQVIQGIFEFTDNKLRICFAPVGQPRPTDFLAKEGSRHTLTVWGRSALGSPHAENESPKKMDASAVNALRRVSDAIRDCKSLHCRAAITSRVVPGIPGDVKMEVEYRIQRDNLLSLHITNPARAEHNTTIRSDGKRWIAVWPSRNEYFEEIAPRNWADLRDSLIHFGHEATGSLIQNLLDEDPFSLFLDSVNRCEDLGTEQLEKQSANRIRCEQPEMAWEIWITPETPPRVLRFRTKRVGALMTQSTDELYSDWRIDEKFPDKSFSIPIPQGAIRLEHL